MSKLAALGVLATLFALIWGLVLVPVANWRADVLARSAAFAADIERLQEARARLDAQKASFEVQDTETAFWTAAQPGEAYARIQGSLAQSASENGISFRAMTPLPTAAREGIASAIVRIEFEADVAQLTGFLRAIEYASPALPVDRAVLRRLVRPNDTSRLPVLFSQIDIAAPLQIAEVE